MDVGGLAWIYTSQGCTLYSRAVCFSFKMHFCKPSGNVPQSVKSLPGGSLHQSSGVQVRRWVLLGWAGMLVLMLGWCCSALSFSSVRPAVLPVQTLQLSEQDSKSINKGRQGMFRWDANANV